MPGADGKVGKNTRAALALASPKPAETPPVPGAPGDAFDPYLPAQAGEGDIVSS